MTAVLFHIPGTTPNAATVLDGFPMTQKGLGGRAVGNALAASAFGGVFGGMCLILMIFIVKPIVMAFGLPEYFFLIFMGLSFIAVLGSDSMIKGFLSGIIGILFSLVGVSRLIPFLIH